jgi:N-acetylneuraminic acid mutarotase
LSSSQVLSGKASENQWTSLSPMPTERGDHGIAEVNGKIYVIGGRNENGNLNNNEEYDIFTDSWSVKASMPTARRSFSIAVYQNKIYCIGGITGDMNSPELTGLTEVYDPIKDTWEVKASIPTARADLCANVVDDAIYLIGGKNFIGVDPYFQEIGLNEVYFPDNDSWIRRSPMFIPVFGYASVVVEGKIFIVGGARLFEEEGSGISVRFNQMYDPEIDAWRNLAVMPNVKSHSGSDVTKGITAPILIYSIGGLDQLGYSETNYAYDIENNNWTIAAPIPSPRANLGVVEYDDVLFAIGGFDGNNWLSVNEQFKPLEYGTVMPKLSLLSPENKTYASNNVSLIISVNRATNWIGNSLDDKENVTISGDTILSGLTDGLHKLIVYINDTFGNTISSDIIQFSVDTKPPIISVLSPENRSYGELDIQSTITIDEPVSWIGYILDGQEMVTITGNVTLAVLSEGSHFINFYATDSIGNNGSSVRIYFNVAPFPTLIVISTILIVIIILMAAYLFLNRKQKEK